jgi:RNA polymerase sigma-70 factor (ECF subfamily)
MNDEAPDTIQLLRQARQGDEAALGRLLEQHRESLNRLAERQLQGRLAVRAGASDVVQQTFLEAHRCFGQFAGQGDAELLSWLRTILQHNIAGIIRDHALLQKRSVRREQSLADSHGGAASTPPEPAAKQSTPSQRAMRSEDADRLERGLAALPEDQREAVRLRHLEGWPLDRIAEHMGRSAAATAGLIKRGMQALRKQLGDKD